MSDPIKIKIADLIKDTEDGLKRQDIAKKYDLSMKDVTDIFKHEKLKNLRAKTQPKYILVDDKNEEDEKVDESTEDTKEDATEDTKEDVEESEEEPNKEPEEDDEDDW